MQSYLDFEKPVADLEGKIAELKAMAATDQAVSIDEEVSRLSSRADEALVEIYKKLTPWQKTQVARHPQRPHLSDYIKGLITNGSPWLVIASLPRTPPYKPASAASMASLS